MGRKDLHTEPFDKGTIAKLEIFEAYAEAWIPTFVMQSTPIIHIFDFFAGPGYDSKDIPGTAIRILAKIAEFSNMFIQRGTKITLHLNEFEPDKSEQSKFKELKKNCKKYINQNPTLNTYLTVKYHNQDAEILFYRLLSLIGGYPSLVYFDQNGVKFIAEDYMQHLERLNTTDFLYFVSSSFFKRFGKTPEFQQILQITPKELENVKYKNIHSWVIKKMKERLPINTNLKLFPFSIKKGSRIYGIVFGAKHYRAVDKFLAIAWKMNEINGTADFDIDEDLKKGQLNLFEDNKMTKLEKFRDKLEKEIIEGTITNNKEAIIYAYEAGHIPKHASDLIKHLKGEKRLTYDSKTPGVSYNMAFKEGRTIQYNVKR